MLRRDPACLHPHPPAAGCSRKTRARRVRLAADPSGLRTTQRGSATNRGVTTIVACVSLLAASGTSSAEDPWRMTVVGDTQSLDGDHFLNMASLSEITNRIVIEQPGVALSCGDLVHGFADPNTLTTELLTWCHVVQAVYDAGIRVLVMRGNHEADQGTARPVSAAPAGAPAPAGPRRCAAPAANRRAWS